MAVSFVSGPNPSSVVLTVGAAVEVVDVNVEPLKLMTTSGSVVLTVGAAVDEVVDVDASFGPKLSSVALTFVTPVSCLLSVERSKRLKSIF